MGELSQALEPRSVTDRALQDLVFAGFGIKKPLVYFVSVLSGVGIQTSQDVATRHRAALLYNVGLCFPVTPSSPRGGKTCPSPLPNVTPRWESAIPPGPPR